MEEEAAGGGRRRRGVPGPRAAASSSSPVLPARQGGSGGSSSSGGGGGRRGCGSGGGDPQGRRPSRPPPSASPPPPPRPLPVSAAARSFEALVGLCAGLCSVVGESRSRRRRGRRRRRGGEEEASLVAAVAAAGAAKKKGEQIRGGGGAGDRAGFAAPLGWDLSCLRLCLVSVSAALFFSSFFSFFVDLERKRACPDKRQTARLSKKKLQKQTRRASARRSSSPRVFSAELRSRCSFPSARALLHVCLREREEKREERKRGEVGRAREFFLFSPPLLPSITVRFPTTSFFHLHLSGLPGCKPKAQQHVSPLSLGR